jgi:hypothetical protein
MSTSLCLQACQILANDLVRDLTGSRIEQPVLSAKAAEQTDIGRSQVLGKELCVIATFGGTHFERNFHEVLLSCYS